MKISVDGTDLFELSETQKKVIKDNVMGDIFEEDMYRRLQWVLMHKYEQCFKALKNEWEPKLKELGVKSMPLDDEAFAQLVFARPEYKDRQAREKEQE